MASLPNEYSDQKLYPTQDLNLYQNQSLRPYSNQTQMLCSDNVQEEIYKQTFLANYKSYLRVSEAITKMELADQSYEKRQMAKSRSKMIEQHIVEDITIDEFGNIIYYTENPFLSLKRNVSNMNSPKLYVLKSIDDTEVPCYQIIFNASSEERTVFIASDKLEKGGYLARKFAAAGVHFDLQAKQIKPMLTNLISLLVERKESEIVISNNHGWYKDDNSFRFCKEGDMTWKMVKALAK